MSTVHDEAFQRFEQRLASLGTAHYDLTLFVTGASGLSARAIANVRALCDRYLGDRYTLDVIDVHQHPELMASRRILAAPTLVKDAPPPIRTLVGDMSNPKRVLDALDIDAAGRIAGEALNR